MEDLRVGVVGLSIGRWHVGAFQGTPGARVTAICDLDAARMEETGNAFSVNTRVADWRALVEHKDVDAVSIALPNHLHRPVAVAALEAGKHVLIEKPLALTPEEGEEIKAAAMKAGRTAMVAMKLRYGADSERARRAIADGEIGRPYYGINSFIRAYNGGLPSRPWFSRKATGGGGALYDNGVHTLDLHWYLVGRPKPVQVMGVCYAEFGPRAKGVTPEEAAGFDVEDFGVGLVRFEDGSSILVEDAWLAHVDAPVMQLRVYGSDGGLALWPLRIIRERNGKDETEQPDLKDVKAESQFEHFVRCARTGETPCSSIDDGIMVLRMLTAMYRSADSARSVDL